MREELMLREIDYWLLMAKYYIGRPGFDRHIDDALHRVYAIMGELDKLIKARLELENQSNGDTSHR